MKRTREGEKKIERKRKYTKIIRKKKKIITHEK